MAAKEKELTKEQLERQDFVDNTIFAIIKELAMEKELAWDIEDIAEVRETIGFILVHRYGISEMEFYPYIVGSSSLQDGNGTLG